jgi:hypothetical protein
MSLECSGPSLERLNEKSQSFPGERSRKHQTHCTASYVRAAALTAVHVSVMLPRGLPACAGRRRAACRTRPLRRKPRLQTAGQVGLCRGVARTTAQPPSTRFARRSGASNSEVTLRPNRWAGPDARNAEIVLAGAGQRAGSTHLNDSRRALDNSKPGRVAWPPAAFTEGNARAGSRPPCRRWRTCSGACASATWTSRARDPPLPPHTPNPCPGSG